MTCSLHHVISLIMILKCCKVEVWNIFWWDAGLPLRVLPDRPAPPVLPPVPLAVLPRAGASLHSPGHLSGLQVNTRLASPPLTLSPPSCDEDYFCGWNCRKCSEPDFCSSCGCTTSLGCARNCAKCSGDFSQSAGESTLLPSFRPCHRRCQNKVTNSNLLYSDAPPGCVASSGPAAGSACIFPFIYEGVRYEGCAPLRGSDSHTWYLTLS